MAEAVRPLSASPQEMLFSETTVVQELAGRVAHCIEDLRELAGTPTQSLTDEDWGRWHELDRSTQSDVALTLLLLGNPKLFSSLWTEADLGRSPHAEGICKEALRVDDRDVFAALSAFGALEIRDFSQASAILLKVQAKKEDPIDQATWAASLLSAVRISPEMSQNLDWQELVATCFALINPLREEEIDGVYHTFASQSCEEGVDPNFWCAKK